jgi:3-methyl-2-oxobutanoate hydroxymethyltransferase
MLDIFPGRKAKFVKNYMQAAGTIQGAVELYVKEVKARKFPGPEHSF